MDTGRDTERLRSRLAADQADRNGRLDPREPRSRQGGRTAAPRAAAPRASQPRTGQPRVSTPRVGQIRPRRVWPGIRALAGAALITIALGGLWWSYTLSNASPSTQYVVAVADIAPGTVITSDHVGLQAIDLPGGVAVAAFAPERGNDVLGAVAVNFVGAGELVATSDVRPILGDPLLASAVESRYELSIEIDLARALNGQMLPGELVDIVTTSGTGASAATRRIAVDAQVLAISEIGEAGLGLGAVAVTLAVPSPDIVLEIVAANDQGVLTLVRAPLVRLEEGAELGRAAGLNGAGGLSGAGGTDQSDTTQTESSQTETSRTES